MNLSILVVLLGTLTVTSYRSVPEQTDDSPFITSTGDRVHQDGCAVSRDLLKKWGGPIDYGDVLYIEGYGFKIVNDTMHPRIKRHVDMWVPTYQDEKAVGVRKIKIYLIKKEKYYERQK